MLTITAEKRIGVALRDDEVCEATRQIPIFRELIGPLLDRLEDARTTGDATTSDLVLPMLVSKSHQALRKPIMSARKKAGVEQWPRLWYNLQANPQTELPFPLVCK